LATLVEPIVTVICGRSEVWIAKRFISPHIAAMKTMAKFCAEWRFVESENFDEYLKGLYFSTWKNFLYFDIPVTNYCWGRRNLFEYLSLKGHCHEESVLGKKFFLIPQKVMNFENFMSRYIKGNFVLCHPL
jgi:hypothetical protein